MPKNETVRTIVMRSLIAVGSEQEASFYTQIFQNLAPEKFALIVVDPRCLRSPLFEALISDLKVLSNLDLTPILVVGALSKDKSNVRFQSERLCKALDSAKIKNSKLNCASYQFISDARRKAGAGRFVVLEMTENGRGLDLIQLAERIEPKKMIFLQPSGGFRINGERLATVNIDQANSYPDETALSKGQRQFINIVSDLVTTAEYTCTYVIVSPLNLLSELFTVRGAGTMLRRGARINCTNDYDGIDTDKLKSSIENAFNRNLLPDFFSQSINNICVEENYRGGAIVSSLAGMPYLNKFWVTQEAQGEGIAHDIWQVLRKNTPVFFWRSRNDNTFNNWYMKMCEGMQISGDWRVFWIGLQASEIPNAVIAASNAAQDFEQ